MPINDAFHMTLLIPTVANAATKMTDIEKHAVTGQLVDCECKIVKLWLARAESNLVCPTFVSTTC